MPDTNDLWPENIADSNLVHPGVHLETTGRAAGREDAPVGEGRSRYSGHGQPVCPLLLYCCSHAQLKFELFTLSHGVNFYPLVMKSLNNTIPLNSESEFEDKHKRNLRRAAHPQRRALYPRPGPL